MDIKDVGFVFHRISNCADFASRLIKRPKGKMIATGIQFATDLIGHGCDKVDEKQKNKEKERLRREEEERLWREEQERLWREEEERLRREEEERLRREENIAIRNFVCTCLLIIGISIVTVFLAVIFFH